MSAMSSLGGHTHQVPCPFPTKRTLRIGGGKSEPCWKIGDYLAYLTGKIKKPPGASVTDTSNVGIEAGVGLPDTGTVTFTLPLRINGISSCNRISVTS